MSAIAQTASITLITGVPGNGKTLRAVWYMKQAMKAGDSVYACNVTGLAIDGVTDFPDPRQWQNLPPGSVLVVDEAQQFFRAASGNVPEYIQAMETIRHGGIRLLLLTQSPLLIHANIRALVGLHEHLVRQGGKQLATVYRRSRVMDNVRSEKALLAEDHESWAFPQECYAMYKSAEVHTVKRTLSSKAKRGFMLAAVAACLVGYAIWNGKNLFGGHKEETSTATTGALATGGAVLGSVHGGDVKYANPADYATKHLPRIPTMPWTAEVYDQRPVTSDPQVVCMSSLAGLDASGQHVDASCTCLTEQGTAYDLPQPMCRTLARRGPAYNPYRSPVARSEQQPQREPSGGSYAPAQPVSGSVIERRARSLGTFPESPSKITGTYTPPTTLDM